MLQRWADEGVEEGGEGGDLRSEEWLGQETLPQREVGRVAGSGDPATASRPLFQMLVMRLRPRP